MKLDQVLQMNAGMGEASYANNSLLQKKVISITMPIIEAAIRDLYVSAFPRSLAIADLGCSSGPNTFFLATEVIKAVEKVCRELNHQSPEYQVLLNDLPSNDFNNIFMSLGSFKEELRNELVAGVGPCYLTGVPGSFYGRLFPTKTLHFVHSSYSVHWLSQVPEGIENNKGNIYIAHGCPPNVLKAYYEQFQKDFSLFLKCRAEELVEGGRMVLTLMGRRSDDPTNEGGCIIWGILATALNDMVLQGLVEAEQVDSFKAPFYTPSPLELEQVVLKEGSFTINQMEVSAVNWNVYDNGNGSSFPAGNVYDNVARCMRAVAEPLIASHFGAAIIDDIYPRCQKLIADAMSKQRVEFTNVTISVTKRTCI